MRPHDLGRYLWLLLVSAVLAVVELFFLPLRLDGRVLPDVAALPFPVTILLAAFTLPALINAASRLSARTAVACGPAFVWIGVILAALVVTPGGDHIVLPDWRSLLLLAAGAFPSAVRVGDVLAKAALAERKESTRG